MSPVGPLGLSPSAIHSGPAGSRWSRSPRLTERRAAAVLRQDLVLVSRLLARRRHEA
jgi:hypothetical protein